MVLFVLTPDHAYTFFVVIAYVLVGQVLGSLVNAARGRFKIPLPNLYANAAMFLKDGKVDEAAMAARGDAFNRVQRGHQHMFEIHADAYALFFASSILYPFHAAVAGWFFCFFVFGCILLIRQAPSTWSALLRTDSAMRAPTMPDWWARCSTFPRCST
jgi:hypothetical protein